MPIVVSFCGYHEFGPELIITVLNLREHNVPMLVVSLTKGECPFIIFCARPPRVGKLLNY
jgi:hypothetical protein